MGGWIFKIGFSHRGNKFIQVTGEPFDYQGCQFILKKEAYQYHICSITEYDTEEEALEAGRNVFLFFQLTSIKYQLGISHDTYAPRLSDSSEYLKRQLAIIEIEARNTGILHAEFVMAGWADPTVIYPETLYRDTFANYFATQLPPKAPAVIEMLCSIPHIESNWAKFIICISAIEALVEQGKADAPTKNAVDATLLWLTNNKEIDSTVKDRLKNALGYCKRESITRSCQEEVARRLGEEKSKQIKEFYDLRSAMVHNGAAPSTVKPPQVETAYSLASDFLFAVLEEQRGNNTPISAPLSRDPIQPQLFEPEKPQKTRYDQSPT